MNFFFPCHTSFPFKMGVVWPMIIASSARAEQSGEVYPVQKGTMREPHTQPFPGECVSGVSGYAISF
jgi:hypothetical protein